MRPTRKQRILEALSQLACVVFFDGDADEMLSSFAWRTQHTTLIRWLDWWFGAGHCKDSYEWERRE